MSNAYGVIEVNTNKSRDPIEVEDVVNKNRLLTYLLFLSVALAILSGAFYYATLAGMYKGAGKILSAKWAIQWKLNYPNQFTNHDCTDTWSPSVNGKVPYKVSFYPEVEAAYWMLPMNLDPEVFEKPVAYRLKGRFPFARYMSFHTYDATTGDFVASIKDVDISPDEGSINPYQKQVKRNLENRDYTLWLVPEGAALPQIQSGKNVVTIPAGVKFAPSVLRVYRPDEGKGMNGGVQLPQVSVFNAQSGQPVNKCAPLKFMVPKSLQLKGDDRRFDRAITISKNIRHFRSNGAGFYPNKHNAYLVSEFDRDLGELAVMKWKAPSVPSTKLGGGEFNHQQDLRYWSFCLGGENASNTSYCLVDDEALIDRDGYVTVVLGPEDDELMDLAKSAGINYVPWGIHYRPASILRHMEGEVDFKNSIKLVPNLNAKFSLDEQGGERFIGDYSPSGYYCSEQEFKNNFCNIKSFNSFKNISLNTKL